MRKSTLITVASLVAGALILIHQYLIGGVWFEVDQYLHHENIAVTLIAFGTGVLTGKKLR